MAISFWHIVKCIRLCADNGIVFNPDKFHYAKDNVEFDGFDISSTGYKPTQKLLEALENFHPQQYHWSLINQVSYAFAQTPIISPFKELLKHKSRFYWDETLEQVFQQSKAEIFNSIQHGVRTFEINWPTCLTTDWNRTGIGFILLQKHCESPFSKNTFVDQSIGKLSPWVLDLPGPQKIVTRPPRKKLWL